MDKIEIHVKFKQVVHKTGKTETYYTDELQDLTQYLDCRYTETGDTVFLAVKLNFLLGCRVGGEFDACELKVLMIKYVKKIELKWL